MREPEMTKALPDQRPVNPRVYINWIPLTSSPRGNTRENRREKDGNEECDSRGHACDAGLCTISNTGR